MIKHSPKKSAAGPGRGWVVPIVAAAATVMSLELAQRVSLWAGLALAAVLVVGGVVALIVVRGRE